MILIKSNSDDCDFIMDLGTLQRDLPMGINTKLSSRIRLLFVSATTSFDPLSNTI